MNMKYLPNKIIKYSFLAILCKDLAIYNIDSFSTKLVVGKNILF